MLYLRWLGLCTAILFFTAPTSWARDPTLIPEDYKFCSKDSDCQIIPLRCACCTYDAVHKLHASDYYAFPRDCIDPPCKCADHHWRAACTKGKCTLVDLPAGSPRVISRPVPKAMPKKSNPGKPKKQKHRKGSP